MNQLPCQAGSDTIVPSLTVQLLRPPRVPFLIALLLLAVRAGLGVRSMHHLPWFWWKYGGSALWASALYFLIGLLRARWSVARITFAACGVALAVECSRLIAWMPWSAFRHSVWGRLLIGNIFSLANLPAYAAGIALAACIDLLIFRWMQPLYIRDAF